MGREPPHTPAPPAPPPVWRPWLTGGQRRRLAWAAAASLLLPWLLGELLKLWALPAWGDADARSVQMVDILVIGTTVVLLLATATVAIGCWIVDVMKGPRRHADAYWVDPAADPMQRGKQPPSSPT